MGKLILKIITTPLRIINKQIYKTNKKKIFSKNSQKERFELIYKTNFWSSKESLSGFGSENKNTIIYFKNKKIIGAVAVNNGRDISIIRKIIKKNIVPNMEKIQNINTNTLKIKKTYKIL